MIIGVIAGTPVDTKMGMDYIEGKGHRVIGRFCSNSAEEQAHMQIFDPERLTEKFIKICNNMVENGAEGIFVNCNSLSGAINLKYARKRILTKIVTPLDIYEKSLSTYKCLSVIASGCKSLASIEEIILKSNPNCMIIGAGILPLVVGIETKEKPEKIYRDFRIQELLESFSAMGAEALVLGCTHFPYIIESVKKNLSIPIINPSDKMLEVLIRK